MRIILYISFLSFSLYSFGQVQKRDSLLNALKSHSIEDSLKVNLWFELSEAYRQVNADIALNYARMADTLAQKLKYEKGRAWALNRISGALWMKGNYPDAMRYAFDALKIFEKLNDKKGIAQSYNSIANTYNMENDLHKSLEYYHKSIEIYEQLQDYHNVSRGHSNIGRTYFYMKKYPEALKYIKKILDVPEEKRDAVIYSIALNTSGDVYQAMNQNAKALDYYFKALKVIEPLKINRVITYSTRGISEVYQKTGRINESNYYAEKTLRISKEIGYIENIKNAALILSDNYKKNQDFEQALNYYVEYSIAKDSMYSQEKTKEIKKIQESFTIYQKQKEIELLKTEKKLQNEEYAKQRIILYSLVSGIILVSILFFLMYRSNLIKQKTNRILTIQRNRLTEQNFEINRQREEILSQSEMLKEANNLKDKLFSIIAHDLRSPFNSLLSIIQYLDNQAFTPEELKFLKERLHRNIISLSDMLNNLLAWADQQMNGAKRNVKAIQMNDLVQRNLKVLEIPASEKNIKINAEVEENTIAYADNNQIDSVFRNLLNNAVKFTMSQGSINIKIKKTNKNILVAIQDNGVGIPSEVLNKIFSSESRVSTLGTAKEVGSGLGLMLCKDFVENNEGKIWVESKENEGTTFYFTLPTMMKEK